MTKRRPKVSDLVIVKNYLPPAPKGVPDKRWHDMQMALQKKGGMPQLEVAKITTLRQANLYSWLVLIMGHEWRWVMDNEETLLDPKFKRKPGQA